MDTFRKMVRKSLVNVISEAVETEHSKERSFSRVLDKGAVRVGYEKPGTVGEYEEVGTYSFKPDEIGEINRKIGVIKNRRFPLNKDYAVMLHYFRLDAETVRFDSPETRNETLRMRPTLVLVDSETNSNGNILYAIIRSDVITTIMLVKPYTGKEGMDKKLKVDFVIKNFEKVEAGKIR